MNRRVWIAVSPFALLAACTSAGDQPTEADNDVAPGNAMGGAMMAPGNDMSQMGAAPMATPLGGDVDTSTYLTKAGAGDLFEIESSRAIAAKTGNAEIRKFAQMMIDEHGKSTAKVKAAATGAGLTVATPKLEPRQQALLDGIKNASGEAAGRAYLGAQRAAHSEALTLHQTYADKGDTPALKKAAGEIAPVVQHHIEALAKLSVS